METCDHLGVDFPNGTVRGCKCLKSCCYKFVSRRNGTITFGHCVCRQCTCGAKIKYNQQQQCVEEFCHRAANGGMLRCAPCNKAKLVAQALPTTRLPYVAGKAASIEDLCTDGTCLSLHEPDRKKCQFHLDKDAAYARELYARQGR